MLNLFAVKDELRAIDKKQYGFRH